ncbi:MAG TPA: hypothetical protein VJB96_02295 [Patescibacteria group bacterium]|nr:hypothetical protein [Patescibacteria group bacterium]
MKRAIVALFLFLVTATMTFGAPVVYAEGEDTQTVGDAACNSVPKTLKGECKSCFDGGGAWTAFRCLGGDSPGDFVADFIKLGTGLGGGIAFLLILFSGFQRITSAGNPEKLHEAKELMTAAISGLLLIIFSIFLLRIIGVDILQIPGLSK